MFKHNETTVQTDWYSVVITVKFDYVTIQTSAFYQTNTVVYVQIIIIISFSLGGFLKLIFLFCIGVHALILCGIRLLWVVSTIVKGKISS